MINKDNVRGGPNDPVRTLHTQVTDFDEIPGTSTCTFGLIVAEYLFIPYRTGMAQHSLLQQMLTMAL